MITTEGNQKIEPGIKFDAFKERFDLIPPEPLMELARVYTYGVGKYADRNWEKGMSWGRVFAAIMRHLWKFWSGKDRDAESGCHHLAHAAWGCLTLLQYSITNKDFDDRSTLGR